MEATLLDLRRNTKKILDAIARNETVTISVDPDHLLLFPADVKVKEHSDDL